MATTSKLRKLLHRKSWEYCTPSPVATVAGASVSADKFHLTNHSALFLTQGYSSIFRYDGDEDSWMQLPNSGLAGTFGAGVCTEFRGLGALGGVFTNTATAGTTGQITTNRTIVRNLAGTRIRVIKGTGLGFDGLITANTLGANSVITTDGSTVFDNTTQYQIFSGSLWVQGAGASAGFGVYDLATNVWTAKAATALTWGTDGQLTSTLGSVASMATGTATAGASTTLTNSTKNWQTNQWANSQVRITAGTGKGQIREIASNNATVLTVSAAWDVNPDATSVYSIEGNEDNFYLIGNNAVTLYRYKVTANTWSTLTPTAARAAAAGGGASFNWVESVPTWVLRADDSPVTITTGIFAQNGRYMFSFRGGASNALDIYDIALNTWVSNVSYGNQAETFTAGTSSFDADGVIYLQKDATGRIFKFDINEWALSPLTTNPIVQGAAVVGNKMCFLPYIDGGTELPFLYTLRNTGAELYRMLVF